MSGVRSSKERTQRIAAQIAHATLHILDDWAETDAQTGEATVEIPAREWAELNRVIDLLGGGDFADAHEVLHDLIGVNEPSGSYPDDLVTQGGGSSENTKTAAQDLVNELRHGKLRPLLRSEAAAEIERLLADNRALSDSIVDVMAERRTADQGATPSPTVVPLREEARIEAALAFDDNEYQQAFAEGYERAMILAARRANRQPSETISLRPGIAERAARYADELRAYNQQQWPEWPRGLIGNILGLLESVADSAPKTNSTHAVGAREDNSVKESAGVQPLSGAQDRNRVRDARLDWAIVCPCNCSACKHLYATLQEMAGDSPRSEDGQHGE